MEDKEVKTDFLHRILAVKHAQIGALGTPVPRPFPEGERRPFVLREGAVVAEVKRASPSQGDIDADLDPAALAARYEAYGASAISVLTEESFFKGSLADLDAVRAAVSLPVLRKDFVVDARQIDETAGRADALLLIARLLTADKLARFVIQCRKNAIEPVVEIFSGEDVRTLESAIELLKRTGHGEGRLVCGINSRDLETFEVDLDNACRFAGSLPGSCVPVAFSGVHGAKDAARLRKAGLRRALVGTAAVRDPALLREIARELSKGLAD